MNAWSPQHRNLAALAALLAAGSLGVYLVLLHPLRRDVAALRQQSESLQQELSGKGWPLNATRLNLLFTENSKALNRLKARSEQIISLATSMFDDRIVEFFGSREAFQGEVSRLDYQEEFSRIEQHLKGRGIILAEDVLNLSETTSSASTYQLVLQLWTAERLAALAVAHDLTPALAGTGAGATETKSRQASLLEVLPARAYFTSPQQETAYLLEFPVRLTLDGSLDNVRRFLAALHAGANFLPVSHLQLTKAVPPVEDLATDRIRIRIECSSFYQPNSGLPARIRSTRKPLPPGA